MAQSRVRTESELEDRRHLLLARQLGFEPRRPVIPLYVIGDSHALFFSGSDGMQQVRHRRLGFWRRRYVMRGLDLLPCFHTRHIGAATAWRAGDYGTSTRAREKVELLLHEEIPREARVLLSYGEIDCRCHIPKAVQSGQSVEAAVGATVTRFMRLVDSVRAAGYNVGVWGPAMITPQRQPATGNPFPVIGPFELRSEITRNYAGQLQAAAAARGLRSVSLAGTYHPWSEPAAPDCFCDGYHLSQRLMPHALKVLREVGLLELPAHSPLAPPPVSHPA